LELLARVAQLPAGRIVEVDDLLRLRVDEENAVRRGGKQGLIEPGVLGRRRCLSK
jgi:hypothetical protein